MRLTAEEREWLDAFRTAIAKELPDRVEEVLLFGSKARGDAGPESDLDVLVVLRAGDRSTKGKVRHIGHSLAVTSEAVPSIMVYTREEWAIRREIGSPFYEAVLRDGVPVG